MPLVTEKNKHSLKTMADKSKYWLSLLRDKETRQAIHYHVFPGKK